MNKWILPLMFIAVLAAIGAYLLLLNANSKNQQPETESSPQPVPGAQTPDTSVLQTYGIDIRNFVFSPSTLTIKKGETVIWTNFDSVKHTVTSDSGSELDSNLIGDGETFSHTFNQAGVYNYHCAPHPYMKAKIIVE